MAVTISEGTKVTKSYFYIIIKVPAMFTNSPDSITTLTWKSTPTVGSEFCMNCPSVNWRKRDDFPTVLSPIKIILNW